MLTDLGCSYSQASYHFGVWGNLPIDSQSLTVILKYSTGTETQNSRCFGHQGTCGHIQHCLQVTIPADGARLVVASGAFWRSVNMTHAVKMVHRNTVQEAPVKMQLAATRRGDLKEDPTILIVDLVPGASQTGVLSLEKMSEQVCAPPHLNRHWLLLVPHARHSEQK